MHSQHLDIPFSMLSFGMAFFVFIVVVLDISEQSWTSGSEVHLRCAWTKLNSSQTSSALQQMITDTDTLFSSFWERNAASFLKGVCCQKKTAYGKEWPIAWIGASPPFVWCVSLIACGRYCMQNWWSLCKISTEHLTVWQHGVLKVSPEPMP